jgi:putative phosphoribosyl transferase
MTWDLGEFTEATGRGPFRDRIDAGRRLAALLGELRREDPLVLALPRGGVPVGFEVAMALDAPLDVLVVRKLGVPSQPELGFGALAPAGVRVLNESLVAELGLTDEEIDEVTFREAAELDRRARRYRAGRAPLDVRDRTVVLVDDGIATGYTVRAALRWLATRRPRRVVLAVPVVSPDVAAELRERVDALVAVREPVRLVAIGAWYERFDPVADEEVVGLLERAANPASRGARGSRRAVRVPAGEVELDGDLALPAAPRGVVLFAHGSGSSRLSPRNRRVAEALNDVGLGTLLLDLLTPEEERVDERTGHLRFDIALLSRRLVNAVDWLAAEPATRGLDVGCFGASTGGAAALAAAAARPAKVLAVVSRGGRPDLAGEAVFARVAAPTLLVVGGDDTEVLELNERALRHLDARSRLHVVPGATHLFEEPGALEEVARVAADWFLAHLGSPWQAPSLAGSDDTA